MEIEEVEQESRKDRLKKHFRENKELYYGVGISAVLACVTTIVLTKSFSGKRSTVVDYHPKALVQTNDVDIHIIEVAIRRGHPGTLVRCDQTGDIWPSINTCAQDNGMSASRLSNYLNGKGSIAGDHTFTALGDAPATAQALLSV